MVRCKTFVKRLMRYMPCHTERLIYPDDMGGVEEQLKILQEGIRLDASLVANFFKTTTPLGRYAAGLHHYKALPEHRERQQHFKKTVRRQLNETFTNEELSAANINWDTDWKINIVDHHGLLNHPILVATNIIGNVHQLPTDNPEGIVVLSDSGVPMNNFFHKRGLRFAGNQINVFSHKQRHAVAYAAPVNQSFPLLRGSAAHDYSPAQRSFLERVAWQLESTSTHRKVDNLVDQVSRANFELWPQLFHEDIRGQIPGLFYVANEAVATNLLLEYLTDERSIFTRILFDDAIRAKFIENFNGVTGCWEDDVARGSHFFWGLNDRHEAVSLKLEGNRLVSRDEKKSIRIQLTRSAIVSALQEKAIYPGMFLVYGIAIFHCGIRPLVGYGSMNYQTRMKEAWIRTMREIEPREVPLLAHIPTDGFIGGPKVTFAATANGYEDLYALDIIYRGGLTKEYLDHLRGMPFNALLLPALIDIYDSYVRPDHKQKITITSGQLMGESFGWLKEMRARES